MTGWRVKVAFGEMTLRSLLSVSACLLLAVPSAWCAPEATAPAPATAAAGTAASAPEAEPVAKSLNAGPGAYAEHAPLALFSLGSLAIGGVFYAIHVSSRDPKVDYTAGDRTSLTTAVGAAGLTALIAAGSYFYFAHKQKSQEAEPEADSDWNAQVSGGLAPDGGVSVGAKLTFPLASLSR